MTETPEPKSLSGRDLDLFISRLVTKGVIALGIVAAVSIVQMFRLGMNERYVLVTLASILSTIVLFVYPLLIIHDRGEPRRRFLASSIAVSGFIPYLLGCYLVFYEGFWRLRLLYGFSFAIVAAALFHIVVGYIVVSAIYKVTEFGRAVNAGQLKIGTN